MVLSFSFVELGVTFLARDAFWHTPIVVTHRRIEEAKGGWSCMMKIFLRHFLTGPSGIFTAGVPICLDNGEQHCLYARLNHVLSDGDGLKILLDWKGASGMKPCFRHWNVLAKEHEIVTMTGGEYVGICCEDFAGMQRWTKEELEATIDMLVEAKRGVLAGTMASVACEDFDQACGFNANVDGLLADVFLRDHFNVCEHPWFDWMHNMLQNGTMTDEAWLLCKAAMDHGFPLNGVEAFVRDGWEFPKFKRTKGKVLWHAFDDFRTRASRKADRLKASASELLGLYSMLRHWAVTQVGRRPELSKDLGRGGKPKIIHPSVSPLLAPPCTHAATRGPGPGPGSPLKGSRGRGWGQGHVFDSLIQGDCVFRILLPHRGHHCAGQAGRHQHLERRCLAQGSRP